MRYLVELVDRRHGWWDLTVSEWDDELDRAGRSPLGDYLSLGPRDDPQEAADARLLRSKFTRAGDWVQIAEDTWRAEVLYRDGPPMRTPPGPKDYLRPTTALQGG